jgi:hypothetical protein
LPIASALGVLTVWLSHLYWARRMVFRDAFSDLMTMLLRFPGELLFKSFRARGLERIYDHGLLASEIVLAIVVWLAALLIVYRWRRKRLARPARSQAPFGTTPKLPRLGRWLKKIALVGMTLVAVVLATRIFIVVGVALLTLARASCGIPIRTCIQVNVEAPKSAGEWNDSINVIGVDPDYQELRRLSRSGSAPASAMIEIQDQLLARHRAEHPIIVIGDMNIRALPPGISKADAHAAERKALEFINSNLAIPRMIEDADGSLALYPDGQGAHYELQILYYYWGPLAAGGENWWVELRRVGSRWLIVDYGESYWLS